MDAGGLGESRRGQRGYRRGDMAGGNEHKGRRLAQPLTHRESRCVNRKLRVCRDSEVHFQKVAVLSVVTRSEKNNHHTHNDMEAGFYVN